ncbi:MAG: NADH-quinone oxidoreductase subunit I [Chloroflexi bacterium]|nr:NADH-quinone oxidoreductase subunit I [Chloroflexota bacterium]
MFGTGLLKGLGITLKHFTDTFVDDRRKEPARYEGSIQIDDRRRVIDQPITQEGLLTIQYPEERRLLPERFRYIPMLIWDTEVGEDRCTACGICAKVCPPQCIWIVRDMDDNGKPVTRPAEFYIDVAVCMSCSFCTEFCPFDAIKMNHDYELAVYDRYPQLVYDKAELTVPLEYYAALWPSQFAEEQTRRAQEKEEEQRREEEKKLAAEAKAKAKAASESQAAKRSQEETASPAARKTEENGETAAGDAAEAEAKRARLEEMKRKAAEKAAQRKKESGS